MKPEIWTQTYIQVRHQIREEDKSIAYLYENIYSLSFNKLNEIVFIPKFTWNQEGQSNLPADIDHIATIQQARIVTAMLANKIITPNDTKAGKCEVIDNSSEKEETSLICFVTTEKFNIFQQELIVLERQAYGLNEFIALSDVTNFECIKFSLHKFRIKPTYNE